MSDKNFDASESMKEQQQKSRKAKRRFIFSLEFLFSAILFIVFLYLSDYLGLISQSNFRWYWIAVLLIVTVPIYAIGEVVRRKRGMASIFFD